MAVSELWCHVPYRKQHHVAINTHRCMSVYACPCIGALCMQERVHMCASHLCCHSSDVTFVLSFWDRISHWLRHADPQGTEIISTVPDFFSYCGFSGSNLDPQPCKVQLSCLPSPTHQRQLMILCQNTLSAWTVLIHAPTALSSYPKKITYSLSDPNTEQLTLPAIVLLYKCLSIKRP